MNREAAYTALFDTLKTGMRSLQFAERKLRHWTDVADADMPYLGFAQGNQTPTQIKGLPYRWDLYATVYLYAKTREDVLGATLLNTLLDELEAALALDNLQRQTLGKVFIDTCRISGEIETDEGLLGDFSVAIVPILMIVT